MGQLTLALLGPPVLIHEDRPVAVDTRKAVALLAYLAITARGASRDSLAALLWPEYSQANARAALRRTLSTLNRAIGSDHLDTARDSVAVSGRAGCTVDVGRFRDLLAACRRHGHTAEQVCARCLEPLTTAVTLYRDDFLTGFSLRDSAPFEEWQLLESESLRRELASALARLADVQTGLGDFAAAIATARRWLALDRLNERVHRRLMLLYAWAGERGAAVQQYRDCVQVLDQDLGVAPLDETTQLYAAIRENCLPVPPQLAPTQPVAEPAGAPAKAPTQPAWPGPDQTLPAAPGDPRYHAGHPPPLIGRAAEWQTLQAAYASAARTGHLVVLEGEAGIGKTRLAGEFLDHARSAGAAVLAARCYEGEQNLAYGPVMAALRSGLALPDSTARLAQISGLWLQEAARLLPDLLRQGAAPVPTLSDDPGAQSRFYEGLRQLFMALLTGPAPGVLFLDDVQWADGATLDLLIFLLRRLGDRPVCVLLAWRPEQHPSSGALVHLVTEARRAGYCTPIHLGRLSRADVDALLQAGGIGQIAAPALADRLYAETEGLPFFLVEYLDVLLRESGAPAETPWALPSSVRDLLNSRLRGIQETSRQLLSTAAVIGRSFDFTTLREASGRAEEEVIAGLEELTGAGLVIELPAPGPAAPAYDFSHEKIRTLVYAETSLARRRLLHRRVAGALLAGAQVSRRVDALAGQIAQHYHQAGQEDRAAEYYKRAGEQARALYANGEALEHFRAALALGHPEVAALHAAIGDLQTLRGEYRAALTSYEAAAATAGAAELAGIEHKLGLVYQRRGEWEMAETHLIAAREAYVRQGRLAEQARADTDWSLTALLRGTLDRAQELAVQALTLAGTAGDGHARAQANNILGILASKRGDFAAARAHLEQSLALAEAAGAAELRAGALNNLALAHGAAGESERALALAGEALALAVALGDQHREAAIHNNIADLLHTAGRSDEAVAHVKQAVRILGEIGAEAGDLQPGIWKLAAW